MGKLIFVFQILAFIVFGYLNSNAQAGNAEITQSIDIEKVIEPTIKNDADIVIGSRFGTNNDDIPKYRKVGIKTITGLTNASTGT